MPQMVPSARGTAVAWFASCLFMGQAAGVALAGAVVDEIGAAALFGGSAVMLPVLGAGFAWALKRRAARPRPEAAGALARPAGRAFQSSQWNKASNTA